MRESAADVERRIRARGATGGNGRVALMTDAKLAFSKRRVLQTCCGGARVVLENGSPCGYKLLQLLLLAYPALLCLALCVVDALVSVKPWVLPLVGGFSVALLTTLHLVIHAVTRRSSYVSEVSSGNSKWLSEEDDEDIGYVCSRSGCALLMAGPQGLTIAPTLIASFLVAAGSVHFLSVAAVTAAGFSAGVAYGLFWPIGLYNCAVALSAVYRGSPEANQTSSTPEWAGSTRAFILILLYLVDLFVFYDPSIASLNYALHIIYLLLPVLWLIGFVSEPAVMVEWALEQALVSLGGGTAAASRRRLLLYCGLHAMSLIVTTVVATFATDLAVTVVTAGFGYLLARNILPPIDVDETKVSAGAVCAHWMPSQYWELAVSLLCWGAFTGCVAGVRIGVGYVDVRVAFAAALSVCAFLQFVLSQCQQAAMLGCIPNGIVRGKGAAPSGIRLAHRLLSVLAPLLVCAFVTLSTPALPWTLLPTRAVVLLAMAWLRAYRWAWQHWVQALRVTAITAWTQLASGAPGWTALMTPLQVLIISLLYTRACDLWYKGMFVAVYTATSLRDKKVQPHQAKLVAALAWLLFPVTVGIVLVCVALGSPLVPVFNLPLFIPGAPRPRRATPSVAKSNAVAGDGVYYEQLVSTLRRRLPALTLDGALGEPAPGRMFLLRHDKQTLWGQVLEVGFGHCVVSLKGMEFQDTTSCHHLEAGAMGEVFIDRLHMEGAVAGERGLCSRAQFHVLRPVSAFTTEVYSDAAITFTGIMDSPDNLNLMRPTFFKALVWLLHREVAGGRLRLDALKLPYRDELLEDHLAKFPFSWYLQLLGPSCTRTKVELAAEDPLVTLALSCYMIVEETGSPMSAAHLCRVFKGQLPPSLEQQWMEKHLEFLSLTLKAHRLAFKCVLDQAVVGPIESLEALQQMLDEFTAEWHLGVAGDASWNDAVHRRVPHLLAVDVQDGQPTGRSLSLQEERVDVALLNEEAVAAFWASLAMELYYFTNSDDERFSIQSHTTMLRNLSIQAADPPLGYPTYCSGAISLSTAWLSGCRTGGSMGRVHPT